jgi:hypothetical protein
MVVVSGPSSKRRRTDGGPVSAEQVAQSNATLNLFTGQGQRQNRWMMHGSGSGEVTQRPSAGELSAAEHTALQNNANFHSNLESDTCAMQIEGEEGTAGERLPASASELGRHTSEEGASLVDYESPYNTSPAPVATSIAAPSPNPSNRKSLDAQVRIGTAQGLPSPAPSEEITQSPIVGNIPVPARRHSHPRGSAGLEMSIPQARPVSRPSSRPSVGQGVTNMVAPSNSPRLANSGQLTTNSSGSGPHVNAGGHWRVNSVSAQPTRSPTVPSNGFVQSPLQQAAPVQGGGRTTSQSLQNRAPGYEMAIMPGPSANNTFPVVQGQARRAAAGPAQRAPPSISPNNLSMFFPVDKMNKAIARQRQHFSKPGNGGQFEAGRLDLLHEAAVKQDWFYIILNQLSCLRSITKNLLPQVMINSVPDNAYGFLDSLLGKNEHVRRDLVQWFSEFPGPIMQIYSGSQGQSQMYNMFVHQVAAFLQQLPVHWNAICHESRVRKAPPLVQDLVERFSLHSPVLQSTVFRAIARSVWGTGSSVEQGIEVVMRLHRADQQVIFFRTQAQKDIAYRAMEAGYESWKTYENRRQKIIAHTASLGQTVHHYHEFEIPMEVQQVFGMAPAVPSPALPQRGLPSDGMTPQQQMQAIHENQQSLARQNAWLSAATGAPAVQPGNGMVNQQQLMHRWRMPNAPPPQQFLLQPPRPPIERRIFPTFDQCPMPQPTQPDTTRAVLHQAHLRSPVLGPTKLAPGQQKLYRHVHQFPFAPNALNKNKPMSTFKFYVHSTNEIPETKSAAIPGRRERILVAGSEEYRLRCAAYDPSKSFPDEGSWIGADNVWPDHVYFSANGQDLETRRKLHYGRYLPIDLTPYVKEGENELTVIINRHSKDRSPFHYAIAVERVKVVSHESIVQMVHNRTISAEESLDAIKKSLQGSRAEDDDDIVMTSTTATVGLFDPITAASIFTLPVRSEYCKHRDCFDLEIFLSTRKRKEEGWPTEVDTWRCPICRVDASPQHLIRDGFLMQVREQLKEKGLLDTRAIVIEANGSWKPKAEERTGVRSASLEREERAASATRKMHDANVANAPPKKPAPVVIELD